MQAIKHQNYIGENPSRVTGQYNNPDIRSTNINSEIPQNNYADQVRTGKSNVENARGYSPENPGGMTSQSPVNQNDKEMNDRLMRTVIGGLIGGTLGSLFGAFASKRASQGVNHTIQGLGDAAKTVGQGLGQSAKGVGNGLKSVAEGVIYTVTGSAADAAQGVAQTAQQTAESAANAVQYAADGVSQVVQTGADAVKNTTEGVNQAVKSASDTVANSVKNTADGVNQATRDVTGNSKPSESMNYSNSNPMAPIGSNITTKESDVYAAAIFIATPESDVTPGLGEVDSLESEISRIENYNQ
ncbi:MAG: hypothetical protein HC908_14340 [Calothrix sp. SM1_7_51]|nr:hypothetical protein [Calothrix sp. SM1_7_51]